MLDKEPRLGLTFDDVVLVPSKSAVLPTDVDVRTQLTRNIPITKLNKLVGILTNRDLRFETRLDLKVSQVMKRDKLVTAPEGTSLEKAREILHEHRIEKLPVVNKHGDLKGLITIKDIEKRIKY